MLRAFVLPLLLVPHANGLRVCTTLDKGFDMLLEGSSTTQISDDKLFGFNVDLRKAVLTDMLNISYDLVVMPSYGEVMVETRAGRCDVGWAAFFIYGSRDRCVENSDTCKPMQSLDAARAAAPDGFSWTPWRCCVDFSPPFLTYGVAIVYDAKVVPFFSAVFMSLTSTFFVNFLSSLLLLVVIVSHLMWLAERTQNSEQFPTRYLDGIDDAIWWALVTITTVGYGDKVPTTPAGKLVGILWLFIGLFLYSILCGHMASAFSALRESTIMVNTPSDIARSGMVVCSYASQFTAGRALSSIPAAKRIVGANTADCGQALLAGEADAAVMDSFSVKYWRSSTPNASHLSISPDLNQYSVSIVYPDAATSAGAAVQPYRALIDPAIADWALSTERGPLFEKWAPSGGGGGGGSSEVLEWEMVGTAIGCVSLYALLILGRALGKLACRKDRTGTGGTATRLPPSSVMVIDSMTPNAGH